MTTTTAVWTGPVDGPVRAGTDAHRRLFCRMLIDTFDEYAPRAIDWPDLSEETLARLKALPIWQIAVETEGNASRRMQAIADATPDPLVREAIALNAFEERRHKEVLHAMLAHYAIALGPEPAYLQPDDPEWFFLRTGYGECFDSFFAFGLFAMAKRSGLFPPELVAVFEPVIQEEARHILFFANWLAYRQATAGPLGGARFAARRAGTVAVKLWERAKTARAVNDTSITGGVQQSMSLGIKPRAFLDLCLAENDRRMERYDPRLLRPRLMPAIVSVLRPLVGRRE